MPLFRVSARSSPNSTAGAIANVVREQGRADLQVIGAGAINQAMKAIAIARTFVIDSGIDLVCAPSFTEVEIDGSARTALLLAVFDRHTAGELAPEEVTITQPTSAPAPSE